MDAARCRSLAWTVRRAVVSAFVVLHLAATFLWVIPASPLRNGCLGVVRAYIMPLGLWQYWGMFAPDPMRDTVTVEADVVDSRGLRSNFAFPRTADFTTLGAVPRFRHSKFAANLAGPENQLSRDAAARHAVRALGVPAEAFPVSVHLTYQVRLTPPPGGPPADPMTPLHPFVIGSYEFATQAQVTP